MYIAIGMVASTAYLLLLKRENAARDNGKRDEVIGDGAETAHGDAKNGTYSTVDEAKREKGDEWSGYRYML